MTAQGDRQGELPGDRWDRLTGLLAEWAEAEGADNAGTIGEFDPSS